MFFGSKKNENGNGVDANEGAVTNEPGIDSVAQAAPLAQGEAQAAPTTPLAELDPEVQAKIAKVRTKLHETFGKVALAMMAIPRYRSLAISDLTQFVLDPLMRDRIAIASSAKDGEPLEGTLSGIAIWATVTPEVDAKIREQIKAGTFPIRLKAEEWTGGSINWLLDVIAPNQRLTTAVIANFRQVIKEGDMRIHPIITRLVKPEDLEKMGATPVKNSDATPLASTSTAGTA